MEETETAGILRMIASVHESFKGGATTTLTIYIHPFPDLGRADGYERLSALRQTSQ